MSTSTEKIKLWFPDQEGVQGPICCVCGKPIEEKDHSGKLLHEEHSFTIVIMASSGDASLPVSLEAHAKCMPETAKKLREKNKMWRWI